MESSKRKIARSFKKVRRDMLDLQNKIIDLERKQAEYMDILSKLFEKDVKFEQKPENKFFIASKSGKNFHVPSCVTANNIKKENMVSFDSKKDAIKQGYKACKCIE
jgi:methylphosphotriester-DNA--protein-cysteine methyltransferase